MAEKLKRYESSIWRVPLISIIGTFLVFTRSFSGFSSNYLVVSFLCSVYLSFVWTETGK